MPTYDRRQFVGHAIRYFLRQDYPHKELVIVDDGTDPVGDLVPADTRIRYLRLTSRVTVGAKRNLACEQASGTIIAHWDDDDWHAPWRLRCQVNAITENSGDLCGLRTPLFYDPKTGRAWKYEYPADRRAWLAGSSLVYTRAFWLTHRFPDVNVGEDNRFVWSAVGARIVTLSDPAFHVGIIHEKNISPKQTGGVWWREHPPEEIHLLMGKDLNACDPGLARSAVTRPDGSNLVSVAPPAARNVFACLVHENYDCIVDLVRNLRYFDDASIVLLYNGSNDPRLLEGWFPFERYGAVIHPDPQPMRWGQLHHFALDCMRFALENFPFDTFTVVDSDQLAIQPGYSARIGQHLRDHPGVGLLGSSPARLPPSTEIGPAKAAFREIDLWRPLLKRFEGGEEKFVHWTFWPSTVFTSDAARDLTRFFAGDEMLAQILSRSSIWASEEVVLPTLVALLGYGVAANPCSYDFVRYRVPYTSAQLRFAACRTDVFWLHPIPRRYEHPLREQVRTGAGEYRPPGLDSVNGKEMKMALGSPSRDSLIARVEQVEGWLAEDEAHVLIDIAERTLAELPARARVVEVGSYCGRATILLASVINALQPGTKVWSIDPHDGSVGAADRIHNVAPSHDKLVRNLAAAGLTDSVEIVRARAPETAWRDSISLLLIDGLHDYRNVARDFFHFEDHLVEGGYVAFHDHADYAPGVLAFVDELRWSTRYQFVAQAGSLVVLRKLAAATPSLRADSLAPSVVSPSQRLLLVIPAFISESRHVEMLRVQSLLKDRLRAAWGRSLEICSAAVCDFVDERFHAEVAQIGLGFDFFVGPAEVAAHAGVGAKNGVRRPTNYAINLLARRLENPAGLYVLRVIQDTFVSDAEALSRDLEALTRKGLDTPCVAASIHHWRTTGHAWLCKRMGLRYHPDLVYANGALMMAPWVIWEKYYSALPSEINHYWDDVMMSLWLTQDGGQLVEIGPSFQHTHECDEAAARELYRLHALELLPSVGLPQADHPWKNLARRRQQMDAG